MFIAMLLTAAKTRKQVRHLTAGKEAVVHSGWDAEGLSVEKKRAVNSRKDGQL